MLALVKGHIPDVSDAPRVAMIDIPSQMILWWWLAGENTIVFHAPIRPLIKECKASPERGAKEHIKNNVGQKASPFVSGLWLAGIGKIPSIRF